MTNEELVKEWIDATENDKRDGEYNHWAIDEVLTWNLENRCDDLWEFIKCAYQEEISLKVTSNLAAGPLEDLLAQAGEKYIDEIDALAKTDNKFNFLLGGVWQNAMSDELWQRVCKIRNKKW